MFVWWWWVFVVVDDVFPLSEEVEFFIWMGGTDGSVKVFGKKKKRHGANKLFWLVCFKKIKPS